MSIVLVPKFVLTRIHHHRGEKGDLGRATCFFSQIQLKEEAMVGGKNSDLFILLRLNALFGIKGMKVPVFLQHLVLGQRIFCLYLVML